MVAFLVAGACPAPLDVPTTWLARNETRLPPEGGFDLRYELRLHARVPAKGTYALMVNAYRPDVTPERGWCAEFTAGEDAPGRPVYP